jgi:hypothetical protein
MVLAVAAIGDTADARVALERFTTSRYSTGWSREDGCDDGVEALQGSTVAYAVGDIGVGLRLAEKSLPDMGAQPGVYGARVPWGYPVPDAATFAEMAAGGRDPSLALALWRQGLRESGAPAWRAAMSFLGDTLAAPGAHVAAPLRWVRSRPGGLPSNWRSVKAIGGDALLCELTAIGDDGGFAREVLAARGAYGELRSSPR